jgi:hypothetical protein
VDRVHYPIMPRNAKTSKKLIPVSEPKVDITIDEPTSARRPRRRKRGNNKSLANRVAAIELGAERGGVRGAINLRDPSSYMSVVRQLGALPMSSAGRSFFWTAVHPPTAPSDQLGLPDAATTPKNTIRILTNFNLEWDTSYFDTAPTGVVQYDALLVSAPIPEVAAIIFLRPSGTTTWSNAHVVRRNALDHKEDVHNTFGGLTKEGFSATRITGHSTTCYFSGASVKDQGAITCAAFIPPLDIRDLTVSNKTQLTDPDIVQGVARRTLVTIPSDTEILSGSNPRAYIGSARNGLFTVGKFTSSLMGYAFKPSAAEGVIVFSGSGTGSQIANIPQSFLSIALSVGGVATEHKFDTYSAFKPQSPAIIGFGFTPGHQHAYVSDPSDQTWNVSIFEGLDVQSGFKVKDIVYMDAYVPISGTRAWENKPPPILDMRAIENVVVAHQEMPDGFPSAANDFMDFMRSIGRGLSKGLSAVSGVFGPILSAIPNPIAKAIGIGLPAVSGLLNNLTQDRVPSEIPLD